MKELKKFIINGNTYIITDESAVIFDDVQNLTDEQKMQACTNIGAAMAKDVENEIDRLDGLIAAVGGSGDGTGGSTIVVDDALDENSTNPVQNKVITQVVAEVAQLLAGLSPDAALDPASTHPVQNKVICEQLDLANAALEQIVAMIPTETAINALIDAKLGVIENGTY